MCQYKLDLWEQIIKSRVHLYLEKENIVPRHELCVTSIETIWIFNECHKCQSWMSGVMSDKFVTENMYEFFRYNYVIRFYVIFMNDIKTIYMQKNIYIVMSRYSWVAEI